MLGALCVRVRACGSGPRATATTCRKRRQKKKQKTQLGAGTNLLADEHLVADMLSNIPMLQEHSASDSLVTTPSDGATSAAATAKNAATGRLKGLLVDATGILVGCCARTKATRKSPTQPPIFKGYTCHQCMGASTTRARSQPYMQSQCLVSAQHCCVGKRHPQCAA